MKCQLKSPSIGSRSLESLSGHQRGTIIRKLADLLIERADDIICANLKDIRDAESSGLEKSLLTRLGNNNNNNE